MNMRFYMTPGSCSTGIHILLEELDLIFEAHIVNLPEGEQYSKEYIAINPKSTIPTLVLPNGTSLTEFLSIAYWLARSHPKAGLLPGDIEGDTLALETINYVVGTIHLQGFTRIFTTDQFTSYQSEYESVKAKGQQIVAKGFNVVNSILGEKEYVTGNFSIADAALFYVEFWAVKLNMTLPDNCQAHYQRMRQRPVVRRVLQEEGYYE